MELLSSGANVNGATQDRWTPLHFAAQYSSLPMVRALAQAAAVIAARNCFWETPLMLQLKAATMAIIGRTLLGYYNFGVLERPT